MKLRLGADWLDLSEPLVMGVLNVTPDSFSDAGRFATPQAAFGRAKEMIAEGARIIDVGGESTRPGAAAIGVQQELDRVIPVVETLRRELDCIISIDTSKAAVMDAACSAGAQMINDVNALCDGDAIAVARRHQAAVCLMHMQGKPRTMQVAPEYSDVVVEVAKFLAARMASCIAGGVAEEAIVLDPGFGFGKRLQHNLDLLANLDHLLDLGRPLLVGLSRKSIFKDLLDLDVNERVTASTTAAALAVAQGAAIVRAHEVRATLEAVRVAAAVSRNRRSQL